MQQFFEVPSISLMGKRKYKRIPKKERRNQKLWAEGCRETILLPHVEKYADSMRFGWTAERDYFNRICNEYHTLIHWRLSDDEEPDLPLPIYDINAPPLVEELTAEEQVTRGNRIREKNKVSCFFSLQFLHLLSRRVCWQLSTCLLCTG